MASPLLKILRSDRNYDIAARFYDDPSVNESLAQEAEYVMTGGLSKLHAAALFFAITEVQSLYDGILFLDGDLEFDAAQLNGFLSFARAAELDLAQPAVSRDSYCYWRMAYHQPGYIYRETSFVEVMAPYLSRNALIKTLPTFGKSISTYGLDLIWPSLIGTSAVGVVDAFQVRHGERVDHATGSFYKYLKSIGVDLDEEERSILMEYGVTPERAHSLRGYFWKKNWLRLSRPPKLASVPLGAPERNSESQFLIDCAMRFARLRGGSRLRDETEATALLGPYLQGERIASHYFP